MARAMPMEAPTAGAAPAQRVRRALVADLFCGAGSLSKGANDALIDLGYRPEFVAVNHWPVAIETYLRNHAGARAHCVSLEAAFPAQLVPEGRLDLLMAGIECTYFSRARGGKPVNDQQRMSAWHVVRWCTELRVKRLLLENVPEFEDWGPVDPRTGKALKSRKGEYFRAWWAALESIGFRLERRVLNCADFGDATTRERLFILGRSDGKPIRWPMPSHARRADMFGAERWRAAREIIDWAIPGTSIFDRTICATGRTNLVRGTREYDILFRMLEPHELAAAMSISEPDAPDHFAGNKTEVVRQIGQAVPRRTGRALALALMGDAA